MTKSPKLFPRFSRRDFIKTTSIGVFGAGISKGDSTLHGRQTAKEGPKIKEYRTLGRTGLKVSNIGTGYPFDEYVLRAVLEAGVNFIETSELYGRGNNERLIGRAIKSFDRDKLVIATKVAPKVKEFESAEDIIQRANVSMKRLGTDYVDCYMIHGAESSERVKNEFFHEAADRLKRDGKIRSIGLSCHGHSWYDRPEETMEQVMRTAIEDGRFDVLFFPYNYFESEMGGRVLEACKKENIGTMVMKSNPVILYEYLSEEKTNLEKEGKQLSANYQILYDKFKVQMEQAAEFFNQYGISGMEEIKEAVLQFVLSNPNVDTICYLFRNFDAVEKYIKLSGTKLNASRAKLLSEYKQKVGFLNCRIGCNICEKHCPHHIPVNTILRYNYYFQAKGREKDAIRLYRELPGAKPSACLDCAGYCEDACPHGVATRGILAAAHRNLDLESSLYAD